jgi:endonuclease III
MAGLNRSTLLTQIHKVLKKHFEPVPPDGRRSVLEHALYGLLLENASYALADQTWSAFQDVFYDWNEVRVATVSELTDLVRRLPDPAVTAASIRNLLQAVFETRYAFDLEPLRKENLGQAAKQLESLAGSRPFMVSYVVQAALEGHAIPIDRGALEVLAIVGAITPSEQAAGAAPGLERAIPKNKGIEFGSLLHQLAADLVANPHAPGVHKILLEINPAAKDRLPKRSKKPVEEEARPAVAAGAKPSTKQAAPRPGRSAKGEPAKKSEPAKKPVPAKKPAAAGSAKRKPR